MSAADVISDLRRQARAENATNLSRFFKTGPGQYGEGDVFLGVMVPETRKVARAYIDLSPTDIITLTESPFHEARLCGLIILTLQYDTAKDAARKQSLFDLYLDRAYAGTINNWDLVDVTAPTLGKQLLARADALDVMLALAREDSLWLRRLGVLFTFSFLKVGDTAPTFTVVTELLSDSHDLMHKACGWALREAGKRDEPALVRYLETYGSRMPRTMLRYAIEKFPEPERQHWLSSTRPS